MCQKTMAERNVSEPDNGNVHRAAAKVLQAEKAARPAAPCATYCYVAIVYGSTSEFRVFIVGQDANRLIGNVEIQVGGNLDQRVR